MVGRTVSHYRVVAHLGQGGMGAVYAADDVTLNRRIALKVLPAEMAADPGRLRRFEQEAKAVAALDHPNIVTIHSIEEADGLRFLTMELVEGKTLADLIPKKGMKLSDILTVAIPLADAVAAAHQRGIVHRDLKPSNVMVSHEGRVKVLDFGLAKLREDVRAETQTTGASLPITGEGRIVGTVAYMSPEQAEGRAVDHRSDLFSLGVMLYEMATGERPFKGETTVSILSAILRETPRSVTEVNPDVPRDLARVVRLCLAKEADHRYQSAKDLRNELEALKQESDSGELAGHPAAVPAHGRDRRLALAALAVLIVGSVTAAWLLRRGGETGTERTAAAAAKYVQLTGQRGVEASPSLSPDGKWVVYQSDLSGNWDIYLQNVGGQNPINLTKDSPAADYQPAFSPDGRLIAFGSTRHGGGLFVMGLTGENVRRITDAGFDPAWSPSGQEIAYATLATSFNPYDRTGVSELWVLNLKTGQKRRLYEGDAMQPRWSPNGKRIAFWGVPVGASRRDIFTISAGGGKPEAVTSDEALDWSPAWAPDGKWLYFASDRGGTLSLWRVPIVEETGEVRGAPEAVNVPSPWVGQLGLSTDGRALVYVSFTGSRNIQKFAFDPVRAGVTDGGTWITTRSQFAATTFLDLSPDGRWLVFNAGLTQEDLFICDADGSAMRALTNDEPRDRGPSWSPDGREIAFYSDRGGSWGGWTINADGGGLKSLGAPLRLPRWSPDGTKLVGVDFRRRVSFIQPWPMASKDQAAEVLRGPELGGSRDQAGSRTPQLYGSTLDPAQSGSSGFVAASWAPDGSRLAGTSGPGVVTYDLRSRQYETLTNDGGTWPAAWLNDNRRILYLQQGRLKVVDRQSRTVQEVLSVAPDMLGHFTLSRDNRRLYIVRSSNESDIWLATLKQ